MKDRRPRRHVQPPVRSALAILPFVFVAACGSRPAPGVGDGASAPSRESSLPARVSGVGRLAAGFDFTCASGDDGTVSCWGRNQRAQLGRGATSEFEATPSMVRELGDVIEVSAGGEHACARTREGRVACWGVDDAAVDTMAGVRSLPVFLPRNFGAAQSIAVGARHLCFVTEDARAVCMGWGSDGQLGDGATLQRSVPRDVFGMDGPVRMLSAGEAHTCGVVANDGAYCWGSGRDGRLGTGATQTYAMQSTAALVGGLRASTIAAGGRMTCAIGRDSSVRCWGRHAPGRVLHDGDPAEVFATPFVVPGLERGALAVAVGHTHACAIKDLGTLVCWGWNESGQIGDGSTLDAPTPRAVRGIDEPVSEVAAGRQHTCARGRSGTLYCWGYGAFGQLGRGDTTSSTTPVRVTFR